MNRSWTSRRRQTSPLSRYSLSPERKRRRVTVTSPVRCGSAARCPGCLPLASAPCLAAPPWVSAILLDASVSPADTSLSEDTGSSGASTYSGSTSVMLTSAMLVAGRVPVPLKMTSAMRSPRSIRALCSPSTQLIESDRFDLPHPLGPTMAAVPSPNSRRVRSAKDLKPSSSTRLSLNKPSLPFPFCDCGHGKMSANADWFGTRERGRVGREALALLQYLGELLPRDSRSFNPNHPCWRH